MSSLPASTKRIRSKATEKRWRHRFPHCKSMGAFYCHGNQSFDPICPKTLCSLSPTPVMLHIKFDQDWPTGLRDIQVWKCGWGQTTADCCYTTSSPCEPSAQVSYKQANSEQNVYGRGFKTVKSFRIDHFGLISLPVGYFLLKVIIIIRVWKAETVKRPILI